jgi:type VI secretion system protein ImpM
MIGLFGKLPAHGDFVRRQLPGGFVRLWDEWLQGGIAAAQDSEGDGFAEMWTGAGPLRFHLPAGACGDHAVAGVLLCSQDSVGRRFPLTVAKILPAGTARPDGSWYAAMEAAALGARDGGETADALLATVVGLDAAHAGEDAGEQHAPWWNDATAYPQHPPLPPPPDFLAMLKGGA